MLFRRLYYRSPEGGEGGGGGVAKTYTQAEYDEAISAAKENSYRGGFSEAKRKAYDPLITKARERGFEAADIDELFDSVLGLAEVGKKGSTYNKEAERKLQQMQSERDSAVSRFRDVTVGGAIARAAAAATDPEQVAKLLRYDFDFEVDGNGVVGVKNKDGSPVRKDAFTDMTIEEVVKSFLEKNPHFVKADAKVTAGSGGPKTGTPAGQAGSLASILDKPAKGWTTEEKAVTMKAFKEGKAILKNGILVLAATD